MYAAAGGATYQSQYDFFPLLSAAGGDMQAFGREADAEVHPMWLLRTLPNNVLCHVGIRNNFKGPNGCVTNHCVSGVLALTEAKDALRRGYADRGYYDDRGFRGRRCGSGTTGTIVGAIAGGLLGNEVGRNSGGYYGRGDGTAGAIIGGGIGALAGRAIGRSC